MRGYKSTNYQLIAREPLLGKVPDRLIAKKFTVTNVTVSLIRRRLGIKASHAHCKSRCGSKINAQLLETEVLPILGKQSDAVLGRTYHVTRERIRQLRKIFGIPVYRKSMHYFHNYAT